MAKLIKLENLVFDGYDSQTGKPLFTETNEFACGDCRHLVKSDDKFCWNCGAAIEPNPYSVEHYSMGRKLSNKQFMEAKKRTAKARLDFIKSIPTEDEIRRRVEEKLIAKLDDLRKEIREKIENGEEP